MHDRWAVMSVDGEWARDELGKVITFFQEDAAKTHCALLNAQGGESGWTTEPFTVEDALEDESRSPFAAEGGL